MKTKIIVMLCVLPLVLGMAIFVAAAASGGYVPTPAPVPMKTFNVYANTLVHGYFNLEDPSGPEGMSITIEPNGINITSFVVTPIADYPDARRYTYYFDYLVGETSKTFTVKSFDSRNREVDNSIVFNVLEDALQVFTECGEITEPNEPVSAIWQNNLQEKMRDISSGNLKFHYNGVVQGKWGLSPKYESLDTLKDLIAKYDNSSYVVSNGHLVE